jgi:hypothetical protein
VPAAPAEHVGTLGPGDATLDEGEYVDEYSVVATAGQTLEADLMSSEFDTYLILVAPSGAQEANDDHEGSTSRSYVRTVASESGTYRVLVTSYAEDEGGAYRVVVSAGGDGGTAAPAGGDMAAEQTGDGPAPGDGPAVGTYDCWGTIATYTGTAYSGGAGGVSYPTYSYSTSHLGGLTLERNGTYQIGGASHPYSYDAATGVVTWHGGTYAGRESRYALDAEGRPVITIMAGNTEYACTGG